MADDIRSNAPQGSSPVGANPSGANRWRRFADWDERPLRLDRFAVEDAENGFAAFTSPNDPKPGLEIKNGRVTSLDGKAEADFDMIDLFIARHHIDPEIAPKAMAMPSGELARMLVDFNIPRTELTRLAHGLTPAKLAEVVAQLSAMEIAFAYSNEQAEPFGLSTAGIAAELSRPPAEQSWASIRHHPRHLADGSHLYEAWQARSRRD